jgi:hypothetical protein
MDPITKSLLAQWQATLTEKEKKLYELAKVKLKKTLHADDETDNGSFFPEYCHGFQAWKKKHSQT